MNHHLSYGDTREYSSEDEKNISKGTRTPTFCAPTWSSLRHRFEDSILTAHPSFRFVGTPILISPSTLSSAFVSNFEGSTTAVVRSKSSDSLNVNFRALQHDGLIRISKPEKFTDLTVDIGKLRVNLAVVNTWNDNFIRLPKDGFINKKKKVKKICRCICNRKGDISYAQTVVIHPKITSQAGDKDEMCVKLNELNINTESVNGDVELVKKMSTLSCNQDSSLNTTMNGLLIDQLDVRISNLKIDEVEIGQNSTQLAANSFR